MENLLKQLLNSDTETEVLEFKEAKTQFDKDKLGKYFSALSNEANLKNKVSAWLLLGIGDNKDIVGTSISDKQLNEYKVEVANNTSPSLSFKEVYRVFSQGKAVLMFEIPAAPLGIPVAWKSHYYGRDGESLGGLNLYELERIRKQSNVFDWSAQIIDQASVADLSEEAIALARIQFVEKNPSLMEELNQWDDITFLNKSKICINGKVTNTAVLLLGKSESEHFISPGTAKISWILKDRDGVEKDYEHFSSPLFLNVQKVYSKIRNIKYRYLQEGSLFPDEVNQFEPYTIREALNNCIAHQDYTLGGKINVVEREDGILTFSNSGDFIPQSVEQVIEADAPESRYRNPFLANAMVSLNMIDTIGSGIKRMFVIQKNKFFPLPDYDLANRKVTVKIIGKVMDENYARKLAQMPDLGLSEIILLDKVAKNKLLNDVEIQSLRSKKLIEGRKPNFHISSSVAGATGEKERYIKLRGFKDEHYKKMILEYLDKYATATKRDIDNLLLDILPDVLGEKQKYNKIRNILYAMSRKDQTIKNAGSNRHPEWTKFS